MTWTVTDRGEVAAATGSGDFNVSAFTPAANSLLLAIHGHSNDGSVSGITGHGTWSLITDQTATDGDVEIWGCRVGGSPSSAAVTASRSYTFAHSMHVIELSHTDGIEGSTVANAHGTPNMNDAYRNLGPTTITGSLASFARSTNLTLCVGMIYATFSDGSWSPDTGYTEVDEWAATGALSCATGYIDSEDTTPSIVFEGSFINAAGVFIEIKHAAAAGGGGSANTLTLLGVG